MNEASPNTSIVRLLRKYGSTPIPIDFVAVSLGRRTPEILTYIQELEKAGVIKREGEHVTLAPVNEVATAAKT